MNFNEQLQLLWSRFVRECFLDVVWHVGGWLGWLSWISWLGWISWIGLI